MTNAWPDNLPHGVIDFEPVGGGRSGGAFGNAAPAVGVSSGGPHWRATVSNLSLITRTSILAARMLEGRLDGGAGSVLVPACDGGLRPTVTSATFSVDHASGATDISIAYVGTTLRGGEHFSVDHASAQTGRRMYRVTEILGTSSPQQVRITPPLRDAVTSGDALDFAAPSCPMRLESGFDLPIDLQRFGGIEATFIEYFAGSPAIAAAPTEPDPPEGDARYWRIRAIHTHDGDTLFSPAEVAFLDDWAGSALAGTPISSTTLNDTVLANGFDAAPLTYVSLAGSGGWIGQDNGAPTTRPPEFYLTARTETGYTQMPSELVYEESQDGVSWDVVKVWTGLPPWVSNERRFFSTGDEADAPWDGADPPQWRKQRIRALTVGSGSYFGLSELYFLDTPGGSTTISGSYKGWFVISGEVFALSDGNALSVCATQISGGVGWWFWVDNGLNPRDQIQQLLLQSQFFNPEQAPITFVLEGENWAGDWQNIASFTTTAWPGNTNRRFNV